MIGHLISMMIGTPRLHRRPRTSVPDPGHLYVAHVAGSLPAPMCNSLLKFSKQYAKRLPADPFINPAIQRDRTPAIDHNDLVHRIKLPIKRSELSPLGHDQAPVRTA